MRKGVGKEVRVKGCSAPSFKFGHYRVRYIQLAYNNRYFMVDQRVFGLEWSTLIKTPNRVLAQALIKAVIEQLDQERQQQSAHKKLAQFNQQTIVYDQDLENTHT